MKNIIPWLIYLLVPHVDLVFMLSNIVGYSSTLFSVCCILYQNDMQSTSHVWSFRPSRHPGCCIFPCVCVAVGCGFWRYHHTLHANHINKSVVRRGETRCRIIPTHYRMGLFITKFVTCHEQHPLSAVHDIIS